MITEESFIDCKCPHCGEPMSFPDNCRGSLQECPSCAESVLVPDDGAADGRPLPLPITTERLVLRRLAPGDWKDLLELMSNEELFRFTDGHPLGEEEVLRWLDSDRHVRLTTPGQAFCLGIELRDGGKLAGYLSLWFTDTQRLQAGMNIFLSPKHQRQRLAAEAVAAALAFCFAEIKLHRVTASCDSRHLAACRLFERAGMRREGEFLKDHQLTGEWVNTTFFAMLDEEYRQKHGGPPSGGPG